MNEIVLGSAVFTGLVMMLAMIVLGARKLLWGSGRARLNVNGELVIESALGEKLLGALEHGGVYLPVSCGGVGSCGLCRLKVSGATENGFPLPVERAKLSADDIDTGYRLACQVVVRGDLNITVPAQMLSAESWVCSVIETRTLTPLIKEIVLALPPGESRNFPAGGYVLVNAPKFKLSFSHIEIRPEHESMWRRMGLRDLKVQNPLAQSRAYSLANRPEDINTMLLNVRLALPPNTNPDAMPGVVSSYLFGLQVGDSVNVSGPFGNFFVQSTDQEIILIGGGAGMAPLCSHVYDQLERVKTKRKISYWYGARSLDDLFYVNKMERLAKDHENFSWHVALSEPASSNGWKGESGFIHDVVYGKYLKTHPAPASCEYYLCGPPLMIIAVRSMLDKLGVSEENIFYDDFGD